MSRFNTDTFRSLNESIARVQNPQAALAEAMEYTAALEAVILALCEELELDPKALVEDVMTAERNREHQKKLNRLDGYGKEHSKALKRYHRELESKKVYGTRGKILKRKRDYGLAGPNDPYNPSRG